MGMHGNWKIWIIILVAHVLVCSLLLSLCLDANKKNGFVYFWFHIVQCIWNANIELSDFLRYVPFSHIFNYTFLSGITSTMYMQYEVRVQHKKLFIFLWHCNNIRLFLALSNKWLFVFVYSFLHKRAVFIYNTIMYLSAFLYESLMSKQKKNQSQYSKWWKA